MSDRLADHVRAALRPSSHVLRAVPKAPQAPGQITLADKFDLTKDRIFVSGAQAVVRTLLMQHEIDRRAGHRTAGFVSGYRGSPLGRLDAQLSSAKALLQAADIKFEPGLNEDLAATAIWGSQQAEMRGEGKYDGVFSLWYGKGPGVDRSGDVLRHANLAGTSPLGGVLALMGDDHIAESSSTAHQSEFVFADMMMPVLSPAGVQEIVDYGLLGIAMSRFTGTWTGIKCVKDTVESTAVIDASLDRQRPIMPIDYLMPAGGLNIRPRDIILDQDLRLTRHKHAAILAFLRANKLNTTILSGGLKPRLGIVSTGKAYLDVRQALDVLGIDEVKASTYGLRLYKLACPWPVEPQGLRAFADGLETIMVVEEKRSLIETQVREQLYDLAVRPTCIGKKDETGAPLFPAHGALDTNEIAIAIGHRILRYAPNEALAARVAKLEAAQLQASVRADGAARTPYFCSGCPHNSSTKVPDGARAYAGIGCHYMVQGMDRATEGFTHMGGEGANWIGESAFSTRGHVFQNLGDGTYNHSGTLAIRWAVAAKTNITYKILFNDAVAMTGGQTIEGGLTVDRIAAQCAAEGVAAIAIVADDPAKYPKTMVWPAGTTVDARENLDAVQKRLATVPGTTILIYDQVCASLKRHRRKKGLDREPDVRVVINEAVCEGCGDCGKTSNCVSVQPIETELGRKRTIDQTACNRDLTCVSGFCPAIVTVKGASPRKAAPATLDGLAALPPRTMPAPLRARPFSVILAGTGGTGVVTLGAIMGMAAHLEGKGAGVMDMAGLAQKGGIVLTHVKLAETAADISAIRVAAEEADLVLGCDLVAAASRKVVAAIRKNDTALVANVAALYPGEITRRPEYVLPQARLQKQLSAATGSTARFLDATKTAMTLLGTSLAANMIMLGFAWQSGLVPLGETSIDRAIELNGEAVEMNRRAFALGRRAAAFPEEVAAMVAAALPTARREAPARSLDEIVARRVATLTAYQDAAYAARFEAMVSRAKAAERVHAPGGTRLAEAVAKSYFKLLAIKDEYEVARLYSDGSFAKQMGETFEGRIAVTYHLAPPVLARRDAQGRPVKTKLGPWMARLFPLLAKGKRLRGTRFDLFGGSEERRTERAMIADYETVMDEIFAKLSPDNIDAAVAIAALPQKVRGFGHVKEAARIAAKAEEATLLAAWRDTAPIRLAAE